MARSILVQIHCDRCSAAAHDDHPGLTFGYRGIEYVVDLCDTCAQDLDVQMQAFTSIAERADARERRLTHEKRVAGKPYFDRFTRVKTKRDPDELSRIRTWARANGWPDLGNRGRIPAEAEAAYRAKTSIS